MTVEALKSLIRAQMQNDLALHENIDPLLKAFSQKDSISEEMKIDYWNIAVAIQVNIEEIRDQVDVINAHKDLILQDFYSCNLLESSVTSDYDLSIEVLAKLFEEKLALMKRRAAIDLFCIQLAQTAKDNQQSK